MKDKGSLSAGMHMYIFIEGNTPTHTHQNKKQLQMACLLTAEPLEQRPLTYQQHVKSTQVAAINLAIHMQDSQTVKLLRDAACWL